MYFPKLSEWPSAKILKRIIIGAVILLIIVYPFMSWYFMVSAFPVGFFESQLSFNGEILKIYYSTTNIDLYRIGQLLDYGFMVSYGLLFFSVSLIIARKFENESKGRQVGSIIALIGVFAAICDGIENLFILIMLVDPLGFPNIIAIIHSVFALIKYVCFIPALGYIIIAGLVQLIKK
ncbi:MAG: conserved membrane protein of unknown function [Promethearchaeota archaeon]|nr:MAG: conserved membrane protein of unknown function [Candidatus Lokiarchaeota archaeon]